MNKSEIIKYMKKLEEFFEMKEMIYDADKILLIRQILDEYLPEE